MSSAIGPTSSDTKSGISQTEAKSSSENAALANKDTFLKLLVAQIKHQDPLSPSDGIQFLSQLAQFSGLEQSIEIKKELESIRKILETPQGTEPAEEAKK